MLCNGGNPSETLVVFVCYVQEVAALQTQLQAAQKELKKTQQLLRQLERQLTKTHMTRKESASASQQLQVGLSCICISWYAANSSVDQLT